MPLIPGFAVSLGATLSFAGVVAGIFPIFALIGRPFGSLIGDRLNKKHVLCVALILNGLVAVLYAFVPDLAWMIPIRIIHGLLFSICGTISFAIGAEYIPKDRLGEGVGFLGIGQIIGMAIGPNIGIVLLANHTYQLCFAVSGVMTIIAGLAVMAVRYKPTIAPKAEKAEKRPFSINDLISIELLPNVAFAGIFMLGSGLISSFLVMAGAERGIANVGLYFAVHALVVIFTRPIIGKLVDKKGFAFAISPGYIIAAAALFVIGGAYSHWALVLAAVLFAVGAGGAMPAIQADCLMRLGKARSAVASGTFMIGLDLGMTIGPGFGGAIADAYDFRTMYYSAGVLLLAGFVLYWLYSRRRKKLIAN